MYCCWPCDGKVVSGRILPMAGVVGTRLKGSVSRFRSTSRTIYEETVHSPKENEIESVEACRWLKETGFPQYAQMYEDGQFPVDIASVEKDHDFLDKDSIQSLYRRLSALNKCAVMKVGTPAKKTNDESDDEDQCALSDKWEYQRRSRRWSRKDLSPIIATQDGRSTVKSSSSHDSLLTDQNSSSDTGDSPVLETKMDHCNETDDFYSHQTSTPVVSRGPLALSPKLRRAASERIQGAKKFIKRMESFKSRKSRRTPRNVEISGPVVTDAANMHEKIKHLNCKDLSPTLETPPSPLLVGHYKPNSSLETGTVPTSPEFLTDSNANYRSLNSTSALSNHSSLYYTAQSHLSESDIDSSLVISNGAAGFSPLANSSVRKSHKSDPVLNFTDSELLLPSDYKPGTFPKVMANGYIETGNGRGVNYRTGSFSLGTDSEPAFSETHTVRRGSHDSRIGNHSNRKSIYDNVPVEEDLSAAQEELDSILQELFQNINGLNKAIYGEDAEPLLPPSSLNSSTALNLNLSTDENVDINTSGNSKIDSDTDLDVELVIDESNDQELLEIVEIDQEDSIDQETLEIEELEHDVVSGTISSPDISDHDLPGEELSHDDSGEHIECRERRDSGVGSSLTRAPSDRRRYRIRWHSFQKCHRPSFSSRNFQISNLTSGQLMVLCKLSLLKLTAVIEKYSPSNRSGWISVPRFIKRHKTPDYRDKNVFGVPLTVTLQRTGQPLPQCILYAMRYLRRHAEDAVGIFRKSGVRSRIQKLRNDIEANPELVKNFEDLQAYDVADLLKQYYRELPDCLLTHKLSEIFINVFIYVPVEQRMEAMQAAIVLMPDENREVLQSLLLFLSDIAQHAAEHQMTASNLAVCFAPSLFNMGGSSRSSSPSPRRPRKNLGVPDPRELAEQKAAHECLTMMIQESKKLFSIPSGTMSNCRFSYMEQGVPMTLDELKSRDEIESCIKGLLKESHEKFRGWISIAMPTDVDVAYKKVVDGHPLRLWKCVVDVEAPPIEVLNRVMNERHLWDEDMLKWRVVEKLDDQTEVFQYVRNSMAPHPTRDFCVLRSWRTDLPKGACILVSTSVDHDADLLGGVRSVELASRYLIEPCGAGKSRLTHISRVDTKGRSPEWYKKAYGHICVNFVNRIRNSLKQTAEGPETKV